MLKLDTLGAAIFDLDGTLVDSNEAWFNAEKAILKRSNVFISDDILAKMVLYTYEEIFPEMLKFGLRYDFDTFVKTMDEIVLTEYENNITLKEDAEVFIKRLRGKGIKTAVATSSTRKLTEAVLAANDAIELFDLILTTEEIGKGKGEPDIYLRAASELDVIPDRCLVFEDRLLGIETARNIGMKTVCVYDRYSQLDFFKARNITDQYIYSFADMLSEHHASLIGDN
jgi:HAD superfamily hydrolase (TIGR01509 family)